MKQKTLVILLVIETAILALVLLDHYTELKNKNKYIQNSEDNNISSDLDMSGETEIFREASPDGNFVVYIEEIGAPDFPFGKAHLQVTLFEVIPEDESPGVYYRASFQADVANDGAPADYEIEWLDDGVQIALIGSEQPTAYYVLPFRTLDDRNKNAASEELDISESEVLDGDRVIQEQSFDVELNDWGEVQFVSYMPDGVPLMRDVSFLLTKENQIIYTFPAYEEAGLLESVDAVGFQDIDGDNVKDVIVIMTYVSGAGPTGMVPRKAVRIFRAEGSEFILCHDLMLEILFNIEDEEMSVPAICKYIEENEVYY